MLRYVFEEAVSCHFLSILIKTTLIFGLCEKKYLNLLFDGQAGYDSI